MVATRRSARIATNAAEAPPAKEAPKKAPPAKKKAPKAEKAAAAPAKSEKAVAPKKAKATKAKAKKPTKAEAAEPKKKAAVVAAEPKKKKASKKASDGKAKAVVTVEACKKWGAFKTRANKIAKAVGDRALVEINKEKPGNGNFIVTIEGIDEPIVSLVGMKRPFPALKALDMDEINQKILKALE